MKNTSTTAVKPKGGNWSDLWKKEDWLAVWIGFIIITLGSLDVILGWDFFAALKFKTWALWETLTPEQLESGKFATLGSQLNGAFFGKLLLTGAVLCLLFGAGVKLMGEKLGKFIPAFLALYFIAIIVRLISAEYTLNHYLEWAFWALFVGLLISNTIKVPDWLKPAVKTEFYIKTGLVVMGFSVLFSNIAKFGLYGLGIAWIVTPVVILFMWQFGIRVLKIDNKPLVMTLASATSVCGTSAAIATGAACKAKKEDLSISVENGYRTGNAKRMPVHT